MLIDVSGIPFEVKEVESNSREDPSMGRCDPKKALITINKEMPETVKDVTLIHEWLHGVLENNGLPEISSNETVICVLSTELYRNGFKPKIINLGEMSTEAEGGTFSIKK